MVSYRSGQAVHRYRPDVWRPADTWVAGVSLGVLALFITLVLVAPELLTYYPYPRAEWPPFHAGLAVAALLLTLPGWLGRHD